MRFLVIAALVVVALAVGLWLLLFRDDGASARSTISEPQGSAVAVTAPAHPTVQPGLPGTAPTLPTPAPGEHPRDYVVGDIRVRDHRSGDNKPLDIPPNVHPAEGRALPSQLTHEIAQKVKVVMEQCTADLPKEAREDKPRLEGQISVSIKSGKVAITKSVMQLRGVSGPSVEPTKQCIEQKSIGIENPAGSEADLDNYSINVSFAIP